MNSDVRNALIRARLRSCEAAALATYRTDRHNFLTLPKSIGMDVVARYRIDALVSRSRWSALREVIDSAELAAQIVLVAA